MHAQAIASAEAAKRAVEQNALALRQQLSERAKLLSQLEHTRMQERMNEAVRPVSELAVASDIPTLAEVRDKIEARYAQALGHQEIASEAPAVGQQVVAPTAEVLEAGRGRRGQADGAGRVPPNPPGAAGGWRTRRKSRASCANPTTKAAPNSFAPCER